jgi:hypothetical protein
MNPLSGSNRIPLSPRRQSHTLPSASRITFTSPFPVPSYLRHASLYAERFYATPEDSSVLGAGASADSGVEKSLKSKSSISDALSLGSELAGGRGEGANSVPLLLPTCWDEDDRCALLELSSDGLGVSFAGSSSSSFSSYVSLLTLFRLRRVCQVRRSRRRSDSSESPCSDASRRLLLRGHDRR